MAETIVIINQKGGVGKTTTAINLSAGLAYAGAKVLVVDIDAQGHLSKFTNCQRGRPTIRELLIGEATFEETVQCIQFADKRFSLWVLPATAMLNDFQMTLLSRASAPLVLKKALSPIMDSFDYIVIDCPPAKNQLTMAALVAADTVIVPTVPEFFSIDGITLLLSDMVKDIQESFNPNLKVAGFLVVKYNKSRTKENQRNLETLQCVADYFGTKIFNTKIRENVAIPASQNELKNIFEYNIKSAAAEDYFDLISELAAG